jgi:hypothetical protein
MGDETPLPGQKACKACGRVLNPRWAYCPSCGAEQPEVRTDGGEDCGRAISQVEEKWSADLEVPEFTIDREGDTHRGRVGHRADDRSDRFVKVTREPENHESAGYIGYYTLKIPVEELGDYVALLSKLQGVLDDAE